MRFGIGKQGPLIIGKGFGGGFPPGAVIVYGGQDGTIDYVTPLAVELAGTTAITIADLELPTDTIWHFVAQNVADCGCGLQSVDSLVCVVRVDAAGDAILAAPNAPLNLTAIGLAGGKVKLRWVYSAIGQAVPPTGFNVYIDSGSGFDFENPDDTVEAYAGMSRSAGSDELTWTSAALSHGQLYRFCVRSSNDAGGESQNTNYVSIVADAQGPAAITNVTATWEVN